jgi:alpha-N-arabinofuranosidase
MHPDPTICRVGRDFYLACSTFEYFPGVPIYHSRDLVHWRLLGHALTRRSQLDLTDAPSSGGIYAPTLRHDDGTFFLVTTHVGRGHLVVTARNPRGPWSDPTWLGTDGVDPSLAFLDDRVYLTRTGPGSDADHPFVYQSELDRNGAELRERTRARVIWKGTGGIWTEGPHLIRRGGWYYLLTAEGGTSYGHSVVVARSERPYGPFAPSPHGPLLTHRDRPRHPIQATGHADFVELEDGSTWAVLLGVRPTRGRHSQLGRETFLASVRWEADGWPRLGPLEAVTKPVPVSREHFGGRSLRGHWLFVRNPSRRNYSLRERPGFLRLWGAAADLHDVASPTAVFRRQEQHDVTVRTRVSFAPRHPNERAGLCLRANERFHVALLVCRGELRLERTLDARTTVLGAVPIGRGPVTLELRATAERYVFFGGTGGTLHELGRVRTRGLSAETILERTGRHHFTGTLIGLLATGAGRRATVPADFHWFDYRR